MSSHVLAFCILPNLIDRARQVNVNILEPNVPSASHSPPFMFSPYWIWLCLQIHLKCRNPFDPSENNARNRAIHNRLVCEPKASRLNANRRITTTLVNEIFANDIALRTEIYRRIQPIICVERHKVISNHTSDTLNMHQRDIAIDMQSVRIARTETNALACDGVSAANLYGKRTCTFKSQVFQCQVVAAAKQEKRRDPIIFPGRPTETVITTAFPISRSMTDPICPTTTNDGYIGITALATSRRQCLINDMFVSKHHRRRPGQKRDRRTFCLNPSVRRHNDSAIQPVCLPTWWNYHNTVFVDRLLQRGRPYIRPVHRSNKILVIQNRGISR